MTAPIANLPSETSSDVRRKLDEWFAASDYCDIKFWISPNTLSSQEECEAELWAAIQDFEALKKSDKLVLTPADKLVL